MFVLRQRPILGKANSTAVSCSMSLVELSTEDSKTLVNEKDSKMLVYDHGNKCCLL